MFEFLRSEVSLTTLKKRTGRRNVTTSE